MVWNYYFGFGLDSLFDSANLDFCLDIKSSLVKMKNKNNKDVENWIIQAEDDLEKSKILFDKKKFDGAAFYSQQTIEKCLKAIILKRTDTIVKTHDLVSLGKQAQFPENILKKIKLLGGVYIESRYGFIDEEIPAKKFKEEDVSEFMKISKEVLEWAKKMM